MEERSAAHQDAPVKEGVAAAPHWRSSSSSAQAVVMHSAGPGVAKLWPFDTWLNIGKNHQALLRFFFPSMLEVEPGASPRAGKCSADKQHPQLQDDHVKGLHRLPGYHPWHTRNLFCPIFFFFLTLKHINLLDFRILAFFSHRSSVANPWHFLISEAGNTVLFFVTG